jgi:hypothetical protein
LPDIIRSRKVLVINKQGMKKGEKHGDGENGKNGEGYKGGKVRGKKDGEGDAGSDNGNLEQLHEHLRTS